MAWAKAMLRGQRVLARVDDRGTFVVEGGRVEIRYKPTDSRAYRAAAANLERIAGEGILPDETCVPGAEPNPDSGASSSKRGAKSKSKSKEPSAPAASIAKDAWVAYADGACSGNPGPCGLGLVLIAPEGSRTEIFEYLGEGTNNIAELTAVLRAVEGAPADAPSLVVHTDSQYSIGVLSKGWKAKANQELIANVKSALRNRGGVRLVYVPGHAGVPMNERADALAREAVKSRSSGREVLVVKRIPVPGA